MLGQLLSSWINAKCLYKIRICRSCSKLQAKISVGLLKSRYLSCLRCLRFVRIGVYIMVWLYRKTDNQNFRCFSDPCKSLKFEFLCRKFWSLSFEKGLEMPQDPIYSWFQDLRNIFQDVLCFCYVRFWSFLDWGIVEAYTGQFCLKVCIRKFCFALGLCKVIKHFLMESPTLLSFLI